MQQQNVSVGRIVHYVLPMQFRNGGQIRAAIVVRVLWPTDPEAPATTNLTIFLDGEADQDVAGGDDLRAVGVLHDPDGAPGTWHWPSRA